MKFNLKSFGKTSVRHLFFMVLYLVTIMACTEENPLTRGSDNSLNLGANITALTRAIDAGFEVDDTLGLYIAKWKSDTEQDTLLSIGNHADNVWFKLANLDNTWMPDHVVYFPADDKKIDIYAYYPYQAPAFGSATSIDLIVAANQSAYRNYTRSDFMVAKTEGVKRTPNKVLLTFDHKLSQMVFELKPGMGFTQEELMSAKVKVINAVTNATYDLSKITNATPKTGTNRVDITPCGSWVKGDTTVSGVMAIVVPQELNPTTYIQVTIGNRKFTYKPSSILMRSGCSRKFTITVKNTGLDITTVINPWNNCPAVNGDAEEEFPIQYLQNFTPKGDESVGTEISLIDKRDNQVYRCIKMIDDRWWMDENLKYYNIIGTCRPYNDSTWYLNKYGYLYDWQTAMNSVPDKWHIPTDDEWKALEIALGMKQKDANATAIWRGSDQGTQLKESGNSKMEMQLSGNYENGDFISIGFNGYWWSSTEYGSRAWRRILKNSSAGVYRDAPYKTDIGHSVRCILNM